MWRAKENLYFVQTSLSALTHTSVTNPKTWKQYPKAHAFIVRIPIYRRLRARRKLSLRPLNFFYGHNFVPYNFFFYLLFVSDLCALKRPYIFIFLWKRLSRNRKCSKIRRLFPFGVCQMAQTRHQKAPQKTITFIRRLWSGRGIMEKYASNNNKRRGNDYSTNMMKCKITYVSLRRTDS